MGGREDDAITDAVRQILYSLPADIRTGLVVYNTDIQGIAVQPVSFFRSKMRELHCDVPSPSICFPDPFTAEITLLLLSPDRIR